MASTCVRPSAVHGYAARSCSSEVNSSTTMEREGATAPRPALRGLLYGTSERPPASETAPRVHWDEECIAEHDKERGTRQKIDEPDTPFVRSPQSSDDEAEKSEKSVPAAAPREQKKPEFQVHEEEDDRRTLSPDAMVTLTDRLNEWVDIGSPQSSGRRHSKEESEPTIRSNESSRRVSLVQVTGNEAGPSSSSFKDKRAKHYNEFAAMKAFKGQKKANDSDESSAASDTSDEEALRKKQTKKGVKVEVSPSIKSTEPLPGTAGTAEAEVPTDEWRTKRNAHYRDMAAAFRTQPPQDSDDSD